MSIDQASHGPWTVGPGGYGQLAIRDARGTLVCTLHAVPKDMPRRDVHLADRDATARMLMALPELTEVARALVRATNGSGDNLTLASIADMARAALAKVSA